MKRMRVYFDFENLLKFFRNGEDDEFDDCLRMIKSQLDLYFNFERNQLENKENTYILNELCSGTKSRTSLTPKFVRPIFTRPLKSNCISELSDKDKANFYSIFLLNDDKISLAKSKGELLFGGLGEEIRTLSKLYFGDYQFQKHLDAPSKISNFDFLETFALPATDIFIIDRFIGENRKLFDKNIRPLVKSLCSNRYEAKINIILFTNPKFNEKDKRDKRVDPFFPDKKMREGNKEEKEMDYKDMEDKFEKDLKDYKIKTNVTIVESPELKEEHDRTIYTNYYFLVPGTSPSKFFNETKNANGGRYFSNFSHGNYENKEKSDCLIADLQSYIDKIKENPLHSRAYGYIWGKRKSKLLDF